MYKHVNVLPRKVYGLPGIYGEMEEYGLVKVNYPYVFSVQDGSILTCLSCDDIDEHCDEHCSGCYHCMGDNYPEYEVTPTCCQCDGTSLAYCPECQPV